MYDFVELYGNNSQNYPRIPHLSGAEPVVDLWDASGLEQVSFTLYQF